MAEDGINHDSNLLEELMALRAEIVAETRAARRCIDVPHPRHRASARNLLHCLALRSRDAAPRQHRLSMLGEPEASTQSPGTGCWMSMPICCWGRARTTAGCVSW